MTQLPVGTTVIVDVSGCTKDGIPFGNTPVAGTVVAVSREGVTVQLQTDLVGVNVLTLPVERVLLTQ